VTNVFHALIEGASGDVGPHIGDLPKALTDVDEVLPGVFDDLKEGLDVLGGIPRDGVMEAAHKGGVFPKRRESQLAASDERQATGAVTFIRKVASLKGFLPLRSASTWRREGGNWEALKRADSSASVRMEAFLFIDVIEELHSFMVGRAVSHFGRRSTSSSFTCCTAGTASWRIWAHCSLA
jgi:hypothetical protein